VSVTLYRNSVFADVIKMHVKMRSYWKRVTLTSSWEITSKHTWNILPDRSVSVYLEQGGGGIQKVTATGYGAFLKMF